MIRALTGTVVSTDGEVIVLDVSGFGLEVYATGSLISNAVVGERLTCAAYLQVSDAGMALFGFSDDVERALFLEITQVKTMGGKLSIALLRHLDVQGVIAAILAEDADRLAVPGLGPKRAERICFELRSKVEKKFAQFATGMPVAGRRGGADAEVAAGLVGLGFTQSEAVGAIAASRAESPEREWTEEQLMMAALSKLQRR